MQPRHLEEGTGVWKEIQDARSDLAAARQAHAGESGSPVHPLRLVSDLQSLLDRPDGDKYSIHLDMGEEERTKWREGPGRTASHRRHAGGLLTNAASHHLHPHTLQAPTTSTAPATSRSTTRGRSASATGSRRWA